MQRVHAAQHNSRSMGVAVAGCLSIALLSGSVYAYQPLVTDDTGTQGAGGNQVELAYNRTRDKAPGFRETSDEVGFVYTRGVTDELDLYVGIGHFRISPEDAPSERGFGNVAVGAKWRFYENEASKLSVGVKPEVQLPISEHRESRGFGTAKVSYGTALLVTQETGFGAIHANLAVDRVRYHDDALNAAERRTLFRLSVAPVWDVTEGWKLALDAGVMTNPDRTARARMGYVEVGAIYSPSKNLDLAAGVVRNIMDGAASTTLVTAGMTARF